MAQQAPIRGRRPNEASGKKAVAARPGGVRPVLAIALSFTCFAAMALGAAQSSRAHRMFSDAAVPGLASDERTELTYRQGASKDPFRRDADDYVEGLAKRGITSIPGYRPTPVTN